MHPALAMANIPHGPNEFESVYRVHQGMVFRTAYRITGNAADAEDVLQTVFLRLMRRDADAAPMQQPESYLRRAAINVSLDVIRDRQKAGETPLEDMPSSAVCTELRELRDTLRRALSKLEGRQAEMFALRFFEGYSNQEIAKMMGISQVLVAVTIHRTRSKLQKEIRNTQGGRS